MSSIRISDLSVRLGTEIILDKASIDLEEGEIVLVTGASGSGKTTLLRILSGAIPKIFGGEFRVFSQPDVKTVNKLSFYMSQEPWFGIATPYVWSELIGVVERGSIDFVRDLLEKSGMRSLIHRSTYTLSAGETQRILLLTALLSGKRLLLLDEPTSYLDIENAERFAEYIRRFVKDSDSIAVIADHRIDLWSRHVDKIYAINNRSIEDFRESRYRDYYYESLDKIRVLKRENSSGYNKCFNFRVERYRYPGSRETLLENVEGSMCYGRITLVRGVSGSGKSTLLRILIERIFDERHEENIKIYFENTSKEEIKRDLVFIPDNPLLFFTEPTVREEIRDSTDLLDLLEIPRNRSSLGVKRISSGERRRIAFISAISRGKRLFLIDEPTVGLDPRSKYLLFRLMRELAERGYGFIISSHDPLVELISDEIVEIER